MVREVMGTNDVGEFGTWSDEAHLPAHDVPQLRKFIKAQSPQTPTQGGVSWVVIHLVALSTLLARRAKTFLAPVRGHRAELVHCESFAVAATSVLPEQDSTTEPYTNDHGNDEEDRREEYEQTGCANPVKSRLCKTNIKGVVTK